MGDGDLDKTPELLSVLWVNALEEKRFEDALLIGFTNYLVSRGRNDDAMASALIAIRMAANGLLPEKHQERPELECSFCGTKTDQLVAGPTVFICADCTSIAAKVFSEKAKGKL